MLSQVLSDAEAKQNLAYIGVAFVTWITYDALIRFDEEVEFIWSRPNSWVKWAYAFIRYAPTAHMMISMGVVAYYASHAIATCKGRIIEQLIVIEIIVTVVEIVLMVRVRILYNNNKMVLSMIIATFIAEVIVMITALGITIPRLTFTADCLISGSPRTFIVFWLSSLVFETFLFVLTLYKFFQHVAAYRHQHETILFILVRDGTWAFAMIFVVLLLNMLFYQLIHNPLDGTGYSLITSVMSFTGSHILLNIRRHASGAIETQIESTTLQNTSTLRFAGEDITSNSED